MAFITEQQARAAAARSRSHRLQKSANAILREEASTTAQHFDVFLSHAIVDADIVLGVVQLLKDVGLTVYVDWLEDTQLERENVSPQTASTLRTRMRQSDALFYVYSAGATQSRWMPWELGYFDGHNGHVAVVPVVKEGQGFKGEEFVGLYPSVDIAARVGVGRTEAFINQSSNKYQPFELWKRSSELLRPTHLYG